MAMGLYSKEEERLKEKGIRNNRKKHHCSSQEKGCTIIMETYKAVALKGNLP